MSDPYFERFAGPLGHVILEFNYLEVDGGRMIARLLRQDDVTAGVFAGTPSFLDKLKLIQRLVVLKVQDEALRNEFNKLVKEATTINELRNRYVHAEYMPVIGSSDELLKMLHRRLKDADKTVDHSKDIHDLLQPVDDEALKKLASDIHDLAYRMRVLAERFVDSQP
jgi:hypothetical protein